MITTQHLMEELNNRGVRYCHWKSNLALAKSMAGRTDVDLLVHRADAGPFRTLLNGLGFRPALSRDGESFPSMEHYYALDEESGVLIHVHAYFRVITGESLSKNYRFPVEEMLLQNVRQEGSVRVPTKSAELILFTIRMMLKHTSLVELILLRRYWKHVKHEARWLLEDDTRDEALRLIECWLPSIDANLFSDCVAALSSPAPLSRRIILGRRLRRRLRMYSRHGGIRAWLTGIQKFATMSLRRGLRSQKGMIPRSGGAVIAFVGPEATGKSTLLAEAREWLGEHFAVEQIHAGKPKSTPLTFVPNSFLPALRIVLPSYRSTHIEADQIAENESEKPRKNYPLISAIRSVLLAYDRKVLLGRAFGQAANGTIVLSDRYPSMCGQNPDSPQLSNLLLEPDGDPIRRALARIEKRLYQEIPPPDLVIYLRVPVEVAVLRNRARSKTEPEDYVRRRHARGSNLEFDKTITHQINTDGAFETTVLEVKKALWSIL